MDNNDLQLPKNNQDNSSKKNMLPTIFLIIVSFYMVGSIMQNILAVKTFGNETFAVTTGGTIIAWAVFMSMDIITEIWGKKKSILCFWISALISLFFTAIAWICIVIPGNNAFVGSAYEVVLGTGWRIAIASIIAFILGNYVNTWIMYLMRVNSKDSRDSKGFIARAILSSLLGQLVDNIIFDVLAFAPIGIASTIEQPWLTLLQIIGFTTLIEVGVEAIISPLTAFFVAKLKELKVKEGALTDIEKGAE